MVTRRSELTPDYGWDERTARYRSLRSGKFIAASTVRDALDTAIVNSSKEMRAVTDRLREGHISLADWQRTMAAELKHGHLAAHALAQGGWAQMTPAAMGRAGADIKAQYAYLARFGREIADGVQRLDGSLRSRAALYVQAMRGSYHHARERVMTARGFDEERRVLHATESCVDCIGYAAQQWQPIGSLPGIGQDSRCHVNCRCSMEYRNSRTEQEAA